MHCDLDIRNIQIIHRHKDFTTSTDVGNKSLVYLSHEATIKSIQDMLYIVGY